MEVESRNNAKGNDSLIKSISKENVHFICSAQVSFESGVILNPLGGKKSMILQDFLQPF